MEAHIDVVPAALPITIGTRRCGPQCPTYIIAELSANHGQEFERAADLVKAAASAGADAIKIQTYTADTMTIDSDEPWFRIGPGTVWAGRSLHDLYQEAFTPWEWHEPLRDLAASLGLDFFSSPFDASAADFLESLDVEVYKIASFELVDLPLIAHVAGKGKPLILSTGMAGTDEIDDAVATARDAGAPGVALLRCNSSYPAAPDEMDLRTISDMMDRWQAPVGLSDHTLGATSAVVAVTLGASLLEKHLTLARAAGGPDASFSLEPAEFRALVDAVREAEDALGAVRYGPSPSEQASLAFRRSLFFVADVEMGQVLTEEDVRSIRPANGLPPKFLRRVVGRRTAAAVTRGTPVTWDLIAD